MPKEKMMNQAAFEKMIKEKTAFAELIRMHQEEKQSVIDEFEQEVRRFRGGDISRKALASSIPRTKREISRLDKAIQRYILGISSLANRSSQFAQNQAPRQFLITPGGVRVAATKRRLAKRVARRTARKVKRVAKRAVRRTKRVARRTARKVKRTVRRTSRRKR